MTDDLQVLGPQDKAVQFKGEEIRISPIRMGKLQAFTVAVKPVAQDLINALSGSGDILSVIEQHGDKLIEAVHIASGVPRETLQECLPDEFINLASAVIEVNADFFAQRLLPAVRGAVEGLNKTVKAGQQSFKG